MADGALTVSEQLIAQLGPCAIAAAHDGAPDESDPWVVNRLRDEDRACNGGIVGLWTRHAIEINALTSMHVRRRLHPCPATAWPTLPGSALRRALAVWELRPATVLVLGDVDGLAVLLAQRCAVWSVTFDSLEQSWQRREAKRHGVSSAVCCLLPAELEDPEASADLKEVDVCVIASSLGSATAAQLDAAIGRVRHDGYVLATVASPWSEWALAHLRARCLEPERIFRDTDWPVLPTLAAFDFASDLLLMKRTSGRAHSLSKPTDRHDGAPYAWAEFCDLDASPASTPAGSHNLLNCLAEFAPVPEEHRFVDFTSRDTEEFAWIGRGGISLAGRLQTRRKELLVSMCPADPHLDYALTLATWLTLGRARTRRRRVRSRAPSRRLSVADALS